MAKETTSIVLIPVKYDNARKNCELIENQKYKSTTELREYLKKELQLKVDEDEEEEEGDVLIYDLTDFMEAVNNQELDILSGYYISYVKFI